MLSIVIPIYRSASTLEELMHSLISCLDELNTEYEIIFIDDGSPDNSWQIIEEKALRNGLIKGIKLSRNFGQHPAIMAGLAHTQGEWIVVMDADFQDDPGYIQALLSEARRGYDIVFAKRMKRTDSILKKLWGLFFYRIFSYLTNTRFDGSIGNYGIYHAKVIKAILSMSEPFKVFSLMARWVGFRTSTIEVKHGKRASGKSSYTLSKLTRLAMTIILSYTHKPLELTIKSGIFIAFLALLFAIYNVIAYYSGIIKVVGYASLITSIWLLGGLIIFFIGIIGLYIGTVLEGVKNRPVYITDKKLNLP